MTVRPLTPADADAYADLAHEQGSVFHSPEWTDLYGDRLTRFGVFDKGGELVAGFHLAQRRVLGTHLARNPAFCPQCGPFWRIRARNPVAVLDTQREILTAMAGFLDSGPYAAVSFSLNREVQDTLPFVWRHFKVVPRYTYVLDLAATLEEIARNMSPTRRNDISKAARDGVVVQPTHDPEIVGDLVRGTFARKDLRSDQGVLDAILRRFARAENSFTFTAYADGVAIATAFIVHDRRTAYYLLGGYRSERKHHGAGALALMKAIEHAKSIGLTAFDFEGSMIPAIEKYFRGFGGRLTPYFTVNKAWLPLEMALKLAKRQIF